MKYVYSLAYFLIKGQSTKHANERGTITGSITGRKIDSEFNLFMPLFICG